MFADIVIIGVISYITWAILDWLDSRHLPPGPMRFPFIGSLIQLGLADPVPYVGLDKICKKYGDKGFTRMQFGFKKLICVDAPEKIRLLQAKEETQSRQGLEEIKVRSMYKNLGVLTSEGKVWQESRRFLLRTLREFGFNKRRSMDVMIKTEVIDTLKHFDMEMENNGRVRFQHETFSIPMINTLLDIFLGERCQREDKDSPLMRYLRASRKFFASFSAVSGLYNFWPFMKYLFPTLSGYNLSKELSKEMHDIGRDIFRQAKADWKRKAVKEVTNFTEEFMAKAEEEENDPDVDVKMFTEDQYVMLLMDIMQAGSDTTANNLGFAMLLLSYFPRIQAKVFNEIREVVGQERLPTLADRDKMPYTTAFIAETMRYARVVIFTPRMVSKTFWLDGYEFKKGTQIMLNYHSIAMNKETFVDPENIRPERFITEEGTFDKKLGDKMNPFSVGRRSCLGEALARDSMFLMITSIVQRYQLSLPDGEPLPDLTPNMGMTCTPHDFDAVLTHRVSPATVAAQF